MVSALGTVMVAKAITDASGYFSIDALPIGDYTLQAHRIGFLGSARATVRVSGLSPALQRLQLRKLNAPVETTGTAGTAPVPARPIMAAGFGLPAGTLVDQPDDTDTTSDVANDDHPHNETAFRLRHIKRSILKDSAPIVTVVDTDVDMTAPSLFERAMDSAASIATTFFTDLPFSGEVNLLTTGAFGPGDLFSGDVLPRGVAYMSIGAPTPAGDWSVRAAMNQGDLSSWIVAGAFQSRGIETAHVYKFGYSYSTQDYLGGNLAALAAATDGSRNVGELFALDRWSITPAIAVEYGARYGRYDYLRPGGLFSPKVGITVEPIKHTRVSAIVAQRMLAPGAEEFVASETPGPWLPPERTFAPLGGPGTTNAFSVERARYLDVLVEHDFDENYAVGVRRFYQDVDNQLVTLFGLNVPGGPQSVGHYYVANAGSLGADGWAIRLSSAGKRVRGSIDYSITRARWLERGDMADIAALGAGGDSLRGRGPARRHDVGRDRHSRNRDARIRLLQGQYGFYAVRYVAITRRPRWPLRRANQPGAALRARRHAVGSPPGTAQSLPRSERPCVCLRRTARRQTAEASGRRIPRSVLESITTPAPPCPSTSACLGGFLTNPLFLPEFSRSAFWIGCPVCWKPWANLTH